MFNCTQFKPLQLSSYNAYKFHINYTQLFQYICLFYNIQYIQYTASFHTTIFIFIFIFYLIEVSIMSVYLLICFLSQFIQCTSLFYFLWALNLQSATSTTLFQYLSVYCFICCITCLFSSLSITVSVFT